VWSLRRSCAGLIGCLALGLGQPVTAHAQLCFRGYPGHRCDGFVVLEFTAGAQLNQDPVYTYESGDQSPVYVSWEAGYLHNLGTRSAIGAALRVAADDDGHRFASVLRYRQWLGSTWSVDLAPGLLLGGSMNQTMLSFPSATGGVALNWGDRVAVVVGADQLRRSEGTRWARYAGFRFGTWLAPLATLGLVAVAGATYND
jgi:hypothetical protein